MLKVKLFLIIVNFWKNYLLINYVSFATKLF